MADFATSPQKLGVSHPHLPTCVSVGGPDHRHRSPYPCRLPQPQAVVLPLGEHGHLIVDVFHIDDHLQNPPEKPQVSRTGL